ncbi:hypothetical protein GCM10011581_09040 [Saccharopolyspora subtropica]|uniref:VanZ-like domain-containing protein n=1 Tax=Saccharopolyspora thermophila TaxID=89367 RepID=A0A917JN52_9PSEU|nr:VanZ family protein [Saccharopolyspora subtropica]GGI74268.1 hypothetical protein GCM10011581_09040 [Saccharopolyspora subtropica]
MSALPGCYAALVATGLAALLFASFVAAEHRRHGEFRLGTAVLRFVVLLYALGLAAYVLFPSTAECLAPQWIPLTALTSGAMLAQFACNIALFVPLGALVRRGVAAAVMVGAGVSAVIELTQLTGTWFVHPCPHRVFDIDDIIANTIGAALGGLLAPRLRHLPTGGSGRPASEPRPVTATRRLLGMCCDALLLWWLGLCCARLAEVVLHLTRTEPTRWWQATALWFAPAALLLLATVTARGTSPGQHAVLLRARAPNRRPVPAAFVRWAVGCGGLAIGQGALEVTTGHPSIAVALLWCAAHAWGVTSGRDHRGITGRAAGLDTIDARQSQRAPTTARST